MDAKPLFSIIMATYNRSHLLPRAIASVLNQTYQNFELLIVDDASTDSTEEVCYSFKDERIFYHKHQQNKGALASKNKGIDLARGDYIAFLDDDDELLANALEIALGKLMELSSEGIEIIWFDCTLFGLNQLGGHCGGGKGYVRYEDLLCERMHGDFWLVIKRSLFKANDRFDERLWGNEGYLWWRLNKRSKAYHVPKALYIIHREHSSGHLSDSINRLKHLPRSTSTNKAFFEEYGEEVKRLCPKVYGRKLGILGAAQILIGEKGEGRKACLESFKYHIALESFMIFLLSFLLGNNHIKWLVSNYMNMQERLKRFSRMAR